MKLYIAKIVSTVLPIIGVLCILLFAFTGNIGYGWALFIGLTVLSGIINNIFFRCPHCKKAIPANGTFNQKYCPLCGEDLGMKPSYFSYYGKCKTKKDGTLVAHSVVGPVVWLVSFLILLLIAVAIFGWSGLFKGVGRYVFAGICVISILIGLICRILVSSAAKYDGEYLYFSRMIGVWKKYSIAEIKEVAREIKPFYHVTRGYVVPTKHKLVCIPVYTYKGGEEFLMKLTETLHDEPPEIRPDLLLSRKSEQYKSDELVYEAHMKYYK